MSDKTFDIAIANSRNQLTWQNEQWQWERILRKVQHTHRTAEAYATYISLPVSRQAEIKDVGGFVGGYLLNGRRGKGMVKYRQLLCLDVDFAYPDFWEDFKMFYNCCSLIYSTHKHSPVSPRLRLVIPLDRTVSPEEYEAIGRKIASVLNMRCFDGTGFQPYRMMFWPSTAKDGDYYFRHQEGDWLSADQVLAEYRDWRNVSEWPLCPTETEIIRTDLKKQEDPLEKEGVIGAFCRTYSISEAIEEYIPDAYTPCGDDRYTFAGGTTAAGAVCYDDKFLYSHHSTDPTSGHLCNAFDLVRLHKFGAQDTPEKKVSLGLMMNLAGTDPAVVKELGIFNLDPTIIQGDTDWLEKLEINGKAGEYLSTIDNFLLVLRNDPNLKGRFSHNEFDQLLYVTENKIRREFDEDDDAAAVRHYFEKQYNMYHPAKFKDAFCCVAKDLSFHPIKEYLDSLEWDGQPRLDKLFIDHLGVPDTEYTRAVTRKSFVGAVARVMDPGCKFDYMTVTIGQQGFGKSSLLNDMGKDWFSDTLDSVNGKEAYMQIQGVWMLEVAELSSVKKAEVDAVKKFITARKDKYRIPFAKSTKTVKRQTVFFGSTNEFSFLKDTTGNRRFWPLVITKKYLPGTIAPDQYWAEAVWRYGQGETLFLTDALEATAANQQNEHTEQDERAGIVQGFIEMLLPSDWDQMSNWQRSAYANGPDEDKKGVTRRDKVCAAEIWCELFKLNYSEMTTWNTKYIHTIMMAMPGWQRGNILSFKKYGNQRSYVRIGSRAAEMQEEEYAEFEAVESPV